MDESRTTPVGMAVGSFVGDFPSPDWFRSLFSDIEEAGFSDCLIADRPTHHEAFPDALTLMSLAAATTSRIGILGIVVTPYRQPVTLARELGTIQYVSSNRAVLVPGLGGDYPREMVACGVAEKKELRGRLEEGLRISKRLWSGEVVDHVGDHYRVEGVQQLPAVPALPIWLAHRARSDRSLERTARMADGWLASWVSPKRLTRAKEQIGELASGLGRSPTDVSVVSLLRIYIADTVTEGSETMARFRAQFYGHPYEPDLIRHLQVAGPASYCIDRIGEFVEAGADRLVVQLECPLDEREKQLDRLLAEVLDGGDRSRPVRLRT